MGFCGGCHTLLLSFLSGGLCDGSGNLSERGLLTAAFFGYLGKLALYLQHLSRQGFVPGAELLCLALCLFLALRLFLCFRR